MEYSSATALNDTERSVASRMRKVAMPGVTCAVMVAGLVPRVALMTFSPDRLVRVIPDDAFYYLKVAQNVAAGHGSTFDGAYPTNGYHPLWMAMLIICARVFHDPWVLVRVDLALSLLCGIGSCALLFHVARLMTDRPIIPALAVAVYFLNPQAMVNWADGLETSLCTFMLLLCLALYLRGTWDRSPSWNSAAMFGAALGLLILARTDSAFYVVCLLFGAARHLHFTHRPSRFCIILASTALVVSPWLAWNLIRFHELAQASGVAVPFVLHTAYGLRAHGGINIWVESFGLLVIYLTGGLYKALGIPGPIYLVSVLLTVEVVRRHRGRSTPSNMRDGVNLVTRSLMLLMPGAAALIIVHAFVRWYPRDYYFDHLIALSGIGFAAASAAIAPRMPVAWTGTLHRRIGALTLGSGALALCGLLGLASGSARLSRGPYPWQADMLRAGYWITHNTSRTSVIASFNSGLIGYTANRQVLNLDGVADNAAYDAIRHRSLIQFMAASSVNYYVDWHPFMWRWYKPFLGQPNPGWRMVYVRHWMLPGWTMSPSLLTVFRVYGSDAPPGERVAHERATETR
jgi:hypothetical protein